MRNEDGEIGSTNASSSHVERSDRAIALVWALLATVRALAFLSMYWMTWQKSLPRSNTMLFEWITATGAWPGVMSILLVAAFSLWSSSGLWRGRGWAFVVAEYLCAVHVVAQFGHHPPTNAVARHGVPVYVILFIYCSLRTAGVLGPSAVPS